MKQIAIENVVIGAGTAGLAAYRALRAAGRPALLIEGGPYGTTCARVGCMPSKLLIAAAEAVHGVARWPEFGIRQEGPVTVDGSAVMARVKRERDRFVGFVLEGVDSIPASDKLVGRATFTGPNTIEVAGVAHITFEKAIIATGSSPAIPPLLHALGDRVVVNDDVFSWGALPKSVAVFGPGVIGLELGQALHRLGVSVHMFGRGGAVGQITDPSLRDYALKTFCAEFPLHVDARNITIKRRDESVIIGWRNTEGAAHVIDVEFVIAATGRTPNVRGLGLETCGLECSPNGVPVFDRTTMQCGNSAFFIVGDANQDVPLLHEAVDEGRIAGENAARYPQVIPGQRRTALSIVFSDPQIATIGQRYADLDVSQTVIGKASFEDQGRSRIMLRNKGLLHVYAHRQNGQFLGAEMIGPDAEHIGHLLAWALQLGVSIDGMLQLPFYHPVVEEGLRTALRDAAAQLAQQGQLRSAA
jgi:dihydrolipoamide dehydrogenase